MNQLNIDDINERYDENWPMEVFVHDILSGPLKKNYNAAYSLDVIEHINPEKPNIFVGNICKSINQEGLCIIGAPSLNSQKYASRMSRLEHVNCMHGAQFSNLMKTHFKQHVMFSMNDEVVHTGFDKMAHYFLALCSGVR